MSKLLVMAFLALLLPLGGKPMISVPTQADGGGSIVIYNDSGFDVPIWLEGTEYLFHDGDTVTFTVYQEYNRVYYAGFDGNWVYFAKLVAGQKYKLVEENNKFQFTGGWLY